MRINECDSLKEAQELKQELVDSEVNGYAGHDIIHGDLISEEVPPGKSTRMKITFMNVPLCTGEGTFKSTEITTEEAKILCRQAEEFGSAIGHSGAAEAITALLEVDCPVNRIQYEQPVGEHVICIKLLARMPEGCGNLTREKMDEIGYKFFHLERLA